MESVLACGISAADYFTYKLIRVSFLLFPADVFVFFLCKYRQPGANSTPEHRPQVLEPILFFFVQISNIPEELREDHLHGHTGTHRHFSGTEASQLCTQTAVNVDSDPFSSFFFKNKLQHATFY